MIYLIVVGGVVLLFVAVWVASALNRRADRQAGADGAVREYSPREYEPVGDRARRRQEAALIKEAEKYARRRAKSSWYEAARYMATTMIDRDSGT